ncbi:MAG: MmgE/PrpD family protein, partial [Nitrospinaceae bacterium]
DGAELEAEIKDPKGHPNNPLKGEELEAKFRSCAAPLFSRDRQDDLIAKIWDLDKLEDLGELMQLAVVH